MEKNKRIINLLCEDSEVLRQKLKSLLDSEEKYGDFLSAIEEVVIETFLENNFFQDKDVIFGLKGLIKDIDEPLDFFETSFQKKIYQNFLDILEWRKISKYELILCLRHVLWSVDNRSWLGDDQAYVLWLCHFLDELDEKQKKAYEQKLRSRCKENGISSEQVEAILKNDYSHLEVEDDGFVARDSEFFSLDDSEKVDFVVAHFEDQPDLYELYYISLMDCEDFDTAEKLCKAILKKQPGLIPIELLLGDVYKNKGKILLARESFKTVLKNLNALPSGVIPAEQKEVMVCEVERVLHSLDS